MSLQSQVGWVERRNPTWIFTAFMGTLGFVPQPNLTELQSIYSI